MKYCGKQGLHSAISLSKWTMNLLLCLCIIGLLVGEGWSAVISVNSENLEEILSGQPVLIEFFAPWCGHCKNFEKSYINIGNVLTDVTVAKVDVTESPAVQARFDVDSIPCFFLYKDNKMWKFKGHNSESDILDWVREGHAESSPMPVWSSPVGPMGKSKGFLITVGQKLMKILPFLSNKFGLPEWAGFAIAAFGFGLFIMFVTIGGIYVSVTHAKRE